MFADHQIRSKIESEEIYVSPYEPSMVQPASLDLRLGFDFIRYLDTGHPIDPMSKWNGTEEFSADTVIIQPMEFILGVTLEMFGLGSGIAARVEGKSTLGRLGLIIHSTAGFVDPGFKGYITLEMTNINNRPIILRAGMRICQMAFHPMDEPCERPYGHKDLGSHYQNQSGVTPAAALA